VKGEAVPFKGSPPDGAFGDDAAGLHSTPPLDSTLHDPRLPIGEAALQGI